MHYNGLVSFGFILEFHSFCLFATHVYLTGLSPYRSISQSVQVSAFPCELLTYNLSHRPNRWSNSSSSRSPLAWSRFRSRPKDKSSCHHHSLPKRSSYLRCLSSHHFRPSSSRCCHRNLLCLDFRLGHPLRHTTLGYRSATGSRRFAALFDLHLQVSRTTASFRMATRRSSKARSARPQRP